ncbi:hypothetical protein ACEYYB_11405 [Paracoccus sp. p4-l81]|uniref:hypothetical protein n=1 Tax=Paracoccus sp. p4-l81 TaxID=3342806 RepID=UPI0035B9681C
MTGHSLTPWEAETLHDLSGAYAAMLEQARKPTCPPPWEPDVDQRRKSVSDKLSAIFDSLIERQKTVSG